MRSLVVGGVVLVAVIYTTLTDRDAAAAVAEPGTCKTCTWYILTVLVLYAKPCSAAAAVSDALRFVAHIHMFTNNQQIKNSQHTAQRSLGPLPAALMLPGTTKTGTAQKQPQPAHDLALSTAYPRR